MPWRNPTRSNFRWLCQRSDLFYPQGASPLLKVRLPDSFLRSPTPLVLLARPEPALNADERRRLVHPRARGGPLTKHPSVGELSWPASIPPATSSRQSTTSLLLRARGGVCIQPKVLQFLLRGYNNPRPCKLLCRLR